MKPKTKFKYVKQRYEKDCSVACIAMITELSYEFVYKQFGIDFDKNGMDHNIARKYICENGFDCIQKVAQGCGDIKISNRRMIIPFADIHYISAQQFADAEENHAFVMLKNGKIYDPADSKYTTALDRFYEITTVLGFWKSK